jgi:hypothetical protein
VSATANKAKKIVDPLAVDAGDARSGCLGFGIGAGRSGPRCMTVMR